MEQAYEAWLAKVDEVLGQWGMPRRKWQQAWQFDFDAEYRAGTEAKQAAGGTGSALMCSPVLVLVHAWVYQRRADLPGTGSGTS